MISFFLIFNGEFIVSVYCSDGSKTIFLARSNKWIPQNSNFSLKKLKMLDFERSRSGITVRSKSISGDLDSFVQFLRVKKNISQYLLDLYQATQENNAD